MSKPIRVLITDDDPATADMLKMLISQITSEIITASSGQECIKLTQQYSPDIILLDLILPDMNGAEICEEIRKFSSVPILILSALNNSSMIAATLNAGADNFLSKPVPAAMLTAHIQKLVKRFRLEQRSICASPTKPNDYVSSNA